MTTPDDNAGLEAVFNEPHRSLRIGGSRAAQLVLGSTPWAGGIAASLAREIQERQNRRLEAFLKATIPTIEDRLSKQEAANGAFVRCDEVSALLECVLTEAAQTADIDKLSFLQNFLVRRLTGEADYTLLDFHTSILRKLSGIHLVVLSAVFNRQKDYSPGDLAGSVRVGDCLPLDIRKGHLEAVVPDASLLEAVCHDLASNGLLRPWQYGANMGEFAITTVGRDFALSVRELADGNAIDGSGRGPQSRSRKE